MGEVDWLRGVEADVGQFHSLFLESHGPPVPDLHDDEKVQQ